MIYPIHTLKGPWYSPKKIVLEACTSNSVTWGDLGFRDYGKRNGKWACVGDLKRLCDVGALNNYQRPI